MYKGPTYAISSTIRSFFITAVLLGVRWCLMVVLICIPLVFFNVYTFDLYIFFGEISLQILCPCLIGLPFLSFHCKYSLYTLDTSQIYDLQRFPPSMWVLCVLFVLGTCLAPCFPSQSEAGSYLPVVFEKWFLAHHDLLAELQAAFSYWWKNRPKSSVLRRKEAWMNVSLHS